MPQFETRQRLEHTALLYIGKSVFLINGSLNYNFVNFLVFTREIFNQNEVG